MIETKVKFSEEVFNVSVQHLKLPARPRNCLRHATGIKTVGDLVQKTERELLELHAFGPVSLKQVKHVLAEIGLRLGMHVPKGDPDEPKGRTGRLCERHLDMATVIDQRDVTPRDQMAAAMLQVIFNTSSNWHGCQQIDQEWYWDDMASAAEVAYRLADAMLKAGHATRHEEAKP